MMYVDILDRFIPDLQGDYTGKITMKEMRMLRVALKTQDAINDVLDEEIELSRKDRSNK